MTLLLEVKEMSKRVKVFVLVLVAVVLLAAGSAAAVMAQEPSPPPEPGIKGLPVRVAEILGVSPEELVTAFQQVQQRVREEIRPGEVQARIMARVAELLGVSPENLLNALQQAQQEGRVRLPVRVAEILGRSPEELVNAFQQAQREVTEGIRQPEIQARVLAGVAGILGISLETLVAAFQQAGPEMREEAFGKFLEKAVEKGLIEEGEAIEIEDWWQNRPEAVDRVLPQAINARVSQAIRVRHIRGAGMGWGWPGSGN